MTSPIRSIIEGSLRTQGYGSVTGIETVLNAVVTDLEDNLNAILDAFRAYASERGIDGSEQDRLLENVGLGYYTHPEEEATEDEAPASDGMAETARRIEEKYDVLSARVDALAGLARQHLGASV